MPLSTSLLTSPDTAKCPPTQLKSKPEPGRSGDDTQYVTMADMEISYAESIGFLPDQDRNLALLENIEVMGLPPTEQFAFVGAYPDDSCATIAMYATTCEQRPITSLSARGEQSVSVDAWQLMPGVANVEIGGADGHSATRLLAWVDDPQMYPITRVTSPSQAPGQIVHYDDYWLGALCDTVTVFDSVDDWNQAQTSASADGDRADAVPTNVRPSPTFISNRWLAGLGGDDVRHPSPHTLVTGICHDEQVVTNTLTCKQWYKINADCGIPVTLGLPIGTTPAPQEGSVVDGTVILTGTTGFWAGD